MVSAMTNPLVMVSRFVRPGRRAAIGRCPVCHAEVLGDDGALSIHGVHIHRGCLNYRMRSRAGAR
jgi:hypothetical protein